MSSSKSDKLPFLPGYNFESPTKRRHGAKYMFEARAGGVLPKIHPEQMAAVKNPSSASSQRSQPDDDADLEAVMAKVEKLNFTTTSRRTMKHAEGKRVETAKVPAHIALDKKILTFNGYFEQPVYDSPDEDLRVRYVKVYYHLEDDTIAVIEPAIPNSGLPQGKLVRRQQIPKDRLGNTFNWKDLHVGDAIEIYGTRYHLTNCDDFTRRFYEDAEEPQAEPVQPPEDAYLTKRKAIDNPVEPSTAPDDFDKLRQFLTMDRKVLRFYAVWNNGEDIRPYTLLYFLVDDTVEVREQNQPNDGYGGFPIFLRRQRVPRNHRAISEDFPTICMDPLRHDQEDFVSPADLGIGNKVNILGRELLLYDCDKFTQEFYRRNFGVEDFTPLDVMPKQKPPPRPELPPHTGFGDPEDAIQSALSLVPKPPKRTVGKMLKYGNQALRFRAKMVTDYEPDQERVFVVSYKLADDTISIFEPRTRSTPGGKFLDARRVPRPGTSPHLPEYYTIGDLYIGATIEAFGRKFLLEACDKQTREFAEANTDMFSHEALKSLGVDAEEADPSDQASHAHEARDGSGGQDQFANDEGQDDGNLSMEDTMLQEEVGQQLDAAHFGEYDALQRGFIEADPDRKGTCSMDAATTVLEKASPLRPETIDAVVRRFTNTEELVDYRALLDFLAL